MKNREKKNEPARKQRPKTQQRQVQPIETLKENAPAPSSPPDPLP
jgi:hypothetical protein